MSDIDIYYGAASGQQRAALSRLEPEGVMISHATQNNTPFNGDYDLFVDSGGYHHMAGGTGEYESSDAEYLEYIRRHRPKRWALRDYPCEPDLLDQLGRSVADQQQRTLEHHLDLYNDIIGTEIEDSAVVVLQGWTVEQYLSALEDFYDYGLPLKHVAIGSVCRRNQDEEIAEVVLSVREELPSGANLHAFGVKGSVLRFEEVVEALDSVDSAAYDYQATRFKNESEGNGYNTWRDTARAYLNWRYDLHQKMATESLQDARSRQVTLGDVEGSDGDDDDGSGGAADPPQRVCLCGEEIPQYGDHEGWKPMCRHCQRTALNYWDRDVANETLA
jgi:hypothetical protein